MNCPSCSAANEDNAAVCFTCGTALAGKPIQKGSVIANRYEIQKLLGQGGMGAVYRAHDRLLDEPVAIKVLRPEVAREPDIARRFQVEIKLARKVSHKNVCRIHEYNEDQGLRYISMEYIEGVDLRQVLREKGGLARDRAFEVSLQIAEGLAAIHDVGVIHRDLKTPNLMQDQRGLVRLMDFGIAKDSGAEGTATATGLIVGTPEYMSPEQARGEKVDFRSDIYALGIVIFEVFTGRVPFKADTPLGTILKHLQEPPPLDGPEAAALPDPLKAVLRKALAKSAAERYASVAEMTEALRHARAMTVGERPAQTGTLSTPVAPSAQVTAAGPSPTWQPAATQQAPVVPPTRQAPVPRPTPAPSAGRPAWIWAVVGVVAAGGLLVIAIVGWLFLGSSRAPDKMASEPAAVSLPPASLPVETTLPPRGPTTMPAVPPTMNDIAPTPVPTQPPATEAVRPTPPPRIAMSTSAPVTQAPATQPPATQPAVSRATLDLIDGLKDGDSNRRWHAAESLGNLGAEARPAVPGLIGALSDRNEVVRWRSAEALGKIGPEALVAVPALANALNDSDGLVRTESAKALGLIGPRAREAAPALAKGLTSSDVYFRRESAKALARMGAESRPALSALTDGLKDKDKFVRMECARALGAIGPDAKSAFSALVTASRDSEPLVAKVAADALKTIGGP